MFGSDLVRKVRDDDEQFDERFIDKLELLYEQFDDTVKRLEGEWIFKFDRRLLCVCTIYSLIDLAPEEGLPRTRWRYNDDQSCESPPPVAAEDSRDPMRHFRSGRRLARLSCLTILVTYIYSLIRIAQNNYLQYRYDARLFRYKHLSSNNSDWRARNELRSKLDEAYADLRAVGAPFIEVHFGIALAQLYLIFVSLIVYIRTAIVFRWFAPFHFRLSRIVLDWRAERRTFLELICNEANKVIASSRSFSRVLQLEDDEQQVGLVGYGSSFYWIKFVKLSSREDYKLFIRHHKETVKWLHQMLLEGSLRPLNWDSKWILWLASYCPFFSILAFVGVVLSLTIIVAFLHFEARVVLEFGRAIDWVAFGEVFAVTNSMVVCLIIYISVVVFSSLDQIFYINRLIRLLHRCADRVRLAISRDESEVGRVDSLNRALLYVLMHHKIFVTQSSRVRGAFRHGSLVASVIYFFLPALCRVHMAYLAPALRPLILFIGLVTAIFFNILLLSVCRLHGRSFFLYKSLASLLASLVELQSLSRGSGSMYKLELDKHLVCLLQKELDNPFRLTDQFLTTGLRIRFEHAFLIKMNFWFGVVLFSSFESFRPEQISASLSQFLHDPFKLME